MSRCILELVNAGVIDYTFADDHIAELWQQVLPNIRLHPDLVINDDGQIAWAVRKGNPQLLKSLDRFVRAPYWVTFCSSATMRRPRWVTNPVGKKERLKLKKLERLFRKYAGEYDFDWLMIAAMAYQESHLEQHRRNPSGATGIMQIKPSTAASKPVAIKDISSLENNIHAGVKYLAYLRDRYFIDPAISQTGRAFFSFAAYNAGSAKVRKMRQLAKKMGLDPNRWFDNVEVAALKLVGRETVSYVRNILKYYTAYRLILDQTRQREQVKEALCDEKSSPCPGN